MDNDILHPKPMSTWHLLWAIPLLVILAFIAIPGLVIRYVYKAVRHE